MTIDLSNQAHVEALRWACNQIRMRSVTLTADAVKLAALDALTDPTPAADLIRRLLERRGVHVLAIHGEEFQEERGEVAWVVDDERSTTELGACWIDQLPDRVLALLDAPDRAAALAALRGER